MRHTRHTADTFVWTSSHFIMNDIYRRMSCPARRQKRRERAENRVFLRLDPHTPTFVRGLKSVTQTTRKKRATQGIRQHYVWNTHVLVLREVHIPCVSRALPIRFIPARPGSPGSESCTTFCLTADACQTILNRSFSDRLCRVEQVLLHAAMRTYCAH